MTTQHPTNRYGYYHTSDGDTCADCATPDPERFTETELAAMLRHPDSYVRAMADWTKAYRGWGWRNITPHVATADNYETRLRARLEGLRAAGLVSSNAFYLTPAAIIAECHRRGLIS